MRLFKKKNWAYYLILFGVFALLFFLVRILFDHDRAINAVIGGLVSGGIIAILWWFLDRGHEQVKDAAKEDEGERKCKE